jgi:hypothetical protein
MAARPSSPPAAAPGCTATAKSPKVRSGRSQAHAAGRGYPGSSASRYTGVADTPTTEGDLRKFRAPRDPRPRPLMRPIRSRYLQLSRSTADGKRARNQANASGCARSRRSACRSRQRRDECPFPGGKVSRVPGSGWPVEHSAPAPAGQRAAVIKEATTSTFVFREDPGGAWRTALVWHPRMLQVSRLVTRENGRAARRTPPRTDAHANNH